MQGLQLRKAILDALQEHKKKVGELAPMPEAELAQRLKVDPQRLEAHFTFLKMGGHVEFLHMPDAHGNRARFVGITESGERYLKNPKNFEMAAATDSPFKVVEAGKNEKLITDLPELRKMIQETEWVLDEEKPEILARVDSLEKVLQAEKFDPAAVSALKLYFERHKWLAPHVSAVLKKQLGF